MGAGPAIARCGKPTRKLQYDSASRDGSSSAAPRGSDRIKGRRRLMRKALGVAWRLIRGLPLALLSPLLLFAAAIFCFLADFAAAVTPKRKLRAETLPDTRRRASSFPTGTAATCSKNICLRSSPPSRNHPDNEVIVVDNGSTDGSAEFIARRISRCPGACRSRKISASAAVPTPASARRERHCGAAEQRHARGARFSAAAARRLYRRTASSPSPARSSSATRTSCAKRPG